MIDSRKAQNLARIRDNQRRSRARRKEYLQELEARLRDFEQMGIDASTEIQGAARRVLEENRKLRKLLHERGVSDSEIIVAMTGSDEGSYDQISAAPCLSSTLERRVIPHGLHSAPSSVLPDSSNGRVAPHTPAIPPLSTALPCSTALSSSDSPSPHSMVSRIDTPSPSFHGTPYLQPSSMATPETKTAEIPVYLPYNHAFQNSWPQPHLQQQYVTDPTSYCNTSLCVDEANIIRTMRTDAGPELEAELGCRIPGQDCYINDYVVFSVMNRNTN